MFFSTLQNTIQTFIAEKLSISFSSIEYFPVGGGSINQTFQILVDRKEKFFCKVNSASRFPSMFEKEKNGLELLASKKIFRVPTVLGSFIENDYQFLLLEWIEQASTSKRFWNLFGEQLAALHSISCTYSGLQENNYMGALPQSNEPSSDWIDFFIHQRLEPQIKLALDNEFLQLKHLHQFEKLYTELPGIFPLNNFSLLHGDLWNGNFLCDHSGMPVLIDPAVYYGNPAMDLGMTTLFGGFDPLFYESYKEHFTLPSNYVQQWEICNLYPLLIHLNLFGKGYLQRIISTIQNY